MGQQKADDPKQRAPLVRGLLYPLPLMLQVFPALTGKRRVQLVAEAIGSLVFILAVVVVVAHRQFLIQSFRQASTDLAFALRDAFQPHLHTHIYPHSTISLHVSVLSSDGSLFAACINACTLALVDAGIPMPGLLCACTVGMSGRASTPAEPELTRVGGINESLDPLLDMSMPEEQELPFMTVANTNPAPTGDDSMDDQEENQMLSIVQMGAGVHISYLETMFAVGLDGCKQVREILNGVVKAAGRKVLEGEGEILPGVEQ